MFDTDTNVVADREDSVELAGGRGPSAQEVIDGLAAQGKLDDLFAAMDSGSVDVGGKDGLLAGLMKTALEHGLNAELSSHLGYEKGDPDAAAHANSRNGTSRKTVGSIAGDVDLDVPRDREGTFTPQLVRKGQRRLDGLDAMIISLYAGGMTIRDIEHHLASTLGVELSRETISKVTDAVLESVMAWQTRPLDEFYPVIYLDAIIVKIRNAGRVSNRAAHIAIGVDMDGIKHVLGIWVADNEGASFWASVCANLANRGVRDVLIVCCDGLTGFPEAVAATWTQATVQTCVVHLIRASMRWVNYKDRRAVAAQLKPIYTASDEEAALQALSDFAQSELGRKYPTAVKTWEDAWEKFTPFLDFPPELRHVIYTTNAIESLNFQLRKVTKTRGHFPSDEAAVKLLWLAITNIEDKRARQRAKEKNKPAAKRKAPGRMVEGHKTANWTQALAQLAVAYPERIAPYLHP